MTNNEVLLITIPFEPFVDNYAQLRKLQPGVEIIHYNTKDVDIVPASDWARATVHLTLYLFPQNRAQVPLLKWVHLYSGGINQALSAPLLNDRSVIWTRNGGVHAPQIAEWAVATLLAHYRQIPTLLKWQESQTWRAAEYVPRGDLLGKTIGFLGYGAIARHTARIASACGMRVVAYTLHEKNTPAERASRAFTPARTGDPAGEIPEEWYSGDLDRFLGLRMDVLVVSAPSTEKTRGCLSRERLARLKGCYVINVARGDIIDTDGLVDALNDGTLRGAALDVTDPEPLPEGHPLWSAKNAIVTPHVSGVSDEYMPRTVEILDENFKRLHAGEELINLVLRSDGY
ncbi:related to glycerate dehydrogenase [Cephalotrichum gorgonifer]|uniref:Related to glycerate dehydrogenase n=1 Tax=Cephalotrichum gorgonifer TaxID=2041049 RepID=A0AAE8N1U4_9PEZI|nr:related to glycerate dehydrogenase [Cephalotrichum gorgonifer]